EDVEVLRVRVVQVEPEELAGREQLCDVLAVEVQLARAVVLEDAAGPGRGRRAQDRTLYSRTVEPDGYARFLEAPLGLGDPSAELPPRLRLRVRIALLHALESDGRARAALLDGRSDRLEGAVSALSFARAELRDVAVDARRRRTLELA